MAERPGGEQLIVVLRRDEVEWLEQQARHRAGDDVSQAAGSQEPLEDLAGKLREALA